MNFEKFFTGAAKDTSLLADMTGAAPANGSSFDVDDATGYPTQGAFPIVVGRGLDNEEKMLISQRNGSTFFLDSVFGRGWDGTLAQQHSAGESVELCLDADTANDLMDHVYNVARDDHTQYLTVERLTQSGITPILATGSIVRSYLDPTLMPFIQCTSATHPSAPAEGQPIYETDTDLWYTWNGTAWAVMPGQRLNSLVFATDTARSTGLHDVPGSAMFFAMPSLVGARRVKITLGVNGPWANSGGTLHDIGTFSICRSDNVVLGAQKIVYHNVFGTDYNDGLEFSCEITNSSFAAGVTATVKVRASLPTAASGLGAGSFLRAEVI